LIWVKVGAVLLASPTTLIQALRPNRGAGAESARPVGAVRALPNQRFGNQKIVVKRLFPSKRYLLPRYRDQSKIVDRLAIEHYRKLRHRLRTWTQHLVWGGWPV